MFHETNTATTPTLNPQSSAVQYLYWFKHLCSLAKSLKDTRNPTNGLLFFILSAQEYDTLPNAAANPGVNCMDLIPNIDPSDNNGPRDRRKQQLADQERQFSNVEKLDEFITMSVDDAVFKRLIDAATFGLAAYTITEKLAEVRRTIATPTILQLATVSQHLQQPYPAITRVVDIISDLQVCFQVFELAHQPMQEVLKVLALKTAVSLLTHLDTAISIYDAANPTIPAQTFSTLSARLLLVDNTERPADGSDMGLLAKAKPNRAGAYAATETKAGTETPIRKPRIPGSYCFKHGPDMHWGKDCKDKDRTTGFDVSATKANPKGGRTEPWVRPTFTKA
jgi:hypothetical protein